ncbi:unnamed protein product [Parascedosporium putredinis]|uniref:SP-RING-type domain-containing protein n=1 Tax=Parascedosporium putredinis TaxID=1442378 RepID=A0A9P1M9U0_9PEZI|nr:unnamed protein product [Parascedosporium putredinis]CAI7995421.1 unnamed protein product [Parascedosporium putredinis]
MTGNPPRPQGRPRATLGDTGQISRSNQTLNTFLGGNLPSWMQNSNAAASLNNNAAAVPPTHILCPLSGKGIMVRKTALALRYSQALPRHLCPRLLLHADGRTTFSKAWCRPGTCRTLFPRTAVPHPAAQNNGLQNPNRWITTLAPKCQELDFVMQSGGGLGALDPSFELPRYTLLRQMLLQGDVFSLLVQQLTCLEAFNVARAADFLRLPAPIVRHALAKRFSIQAGLSPVVEGIENYRAAVSTFFLRLSKNWDRLRADVVRRGTPLRVQELVEGLGIRTNLFLTLFFTLTRRLVGIGDGPELSSICEQVTATFIREKSLYFNQNLAVADKQSALNEIAKNYESLAVMARRNAATHLQENNTSHVLPITNPSQQTNQARPGYAQTAISLAQGEAHRPLSRHLKKFAIRIPRGTPNRISEPPCDASWAWLSASSPAALRPSRVITRGAIPSPGSPGHVLMDTPYNRPPSRMVPPQPIPAHIHASPQAQICEVPEDSAKVPTAEDWTFRKTTWPSSLSITVNGHGQPQVPREQNFQRARPCEITQFVKIGLNEISVVLMPSSERSKKAYFAGVDRVETTSHSGIMQKVLEDSVLPDKVTIDTIKARLSINALDDNGSQEVFADQELYISLVDPVSFQRVKIPCRGANCRHLDPFDLSNWLESRPTKKTCLHALTGPAHWTCEGDARPPNIVVDGFLKGVLDSLAEQGLEDVRAIYVDVHGNWRVKEEEPPVGEDSDDDGPPPKRHASAMMKRSAATRAVGDVIVIDDD